jgi:Tol biopolymer transport system component
MANGGVKCWGEDNDGQIGTGVTVTHYTTPQDVSGVSAARAVAAEGDHSCALLASGAAKCWGNSGNGELGAGYPIGGAQPTPQDVLLTEPAQSLEAGWSHTCAVTVAGGAQCWGSPYFVGDGDSTNTSPRARPVDVVGMTSGVTAIAPGMGHSCALSVTGVKCWGFDSEGELGNGTMSSYPPAWSPVPVVGLPDGIQGIASGAHHTCAIKPNGGLVCWGENTYGQLGNNSTNNSSTPVPVSGLGSGVMAVAAGRRHTCALLDTGIVKCWGENAFGQLGRGPGGNSLVPVKVDFVDHVEPNDPTDVNQYQPAATLLAVGATADAPGVVFKAVVGAPSGGPTQLRLEVEIKPVGVPFNGQSTLKGPFVATGATASVTASGVIRGQSYHWRARTVDPIGVTSQWVDFAGNPDSSPDFRLEMPIVFSSNRDAGGTSNELYSMNANGTGVLRLTTTNTTNTEPSLSPDGTRIAFRGLDPVDGDFEIYVMNLDGSNRVNLTNNNAADQAPSWSPDGSRIAFVSNRAAGGAYNIWVMNADGSLPTQVTTTAPSNDNYPCWSPDGSKIAFMSARPPGQDIYVMNNDGSNQTRLGWNSTSDESFPDWSPDGTKIAFASKRVGGQFEIFVGNADGTGTATRLTTKARDDVFPQWSRTGARILFQGFDPSTEADAEIYRVPAVGGILARIGPNNTFADQAPTW